jgi:D-amino-acid dehydrogenase
MKVIIMGAGVIGVTTAYVLATRGYDVEVIDRRPAAAGETSFANGGQLSYSHAEPWANPSVLPKVMKWMFDDEAPLVLKPRLDYRMMRWGLQFLGNCTQRRAESNTVTMLKLGLYSRKKMQHLVEATGIKFDYQRDGILHVFCKQSDFDAARRQADFQEKFGCEEQSKTVDECIQLEPSLRHSNYNLIGGIYAHLDEYGDVNCFTTKLAEICQKEYGVVFHYNTAINELKRNSDNEIAAVVTDKGELTADRYVMSLGSYSSVYLRKLGLNVPIYPMKGYSVTLKANEYAPKMSVTDQKSKIVYSRLGDRLRIAGTAEFAGYNDEIKQKRIKPILKAVGRLFPKALGENYETVESEWACLRPSTPDGPPIIGQTPIKNLYMNTGHGTLGWTQAAGSAFLFADSFEGKETEVSLDGMHVERYL